MDQASLKANADYRCQCGAVANFSIWSWGSLGDGIHTLHYCRDHRPKDFMPAERRADDEKG